MPVIGGIADMVHSGHFTLLRTAVSQGLGGSDARLVGRRWGMGMRRRRGRREMLMERVMVMVDRARRVQCVFSEPSVGPTVQADDMITSTGFAMRILVHTSDLI